MGSFRQATWARATAIILFFVFMISTVALPVIVNTLLKQDIANRFVLDSPNKTRYAAWQDSRTPNAPEIMYTFWMYNVTNPSGILNGDKPHLQEVGPFVYRLQEIKLDVEFSADGPGNTVNYTQWRYYLPVGNNASTTNITTLNVPFQALAALATGGLSIVVEGLYAHMTDEESLFTTRPVNDYLFGYEDKQLYELSKTLPTVTDGRFPGFQTNLTDLAAVRKHRFGMSMHTGKADINLMQSLTRWQGMHEVYCCSSGPCGPKGGPLGWGSHEAAAVKGAVGAQFKPFLDEYDSIDAFVQSLSRYASLKNYGEHETYRGVDLLRFSIPPQLMESDKTYKPNTAYYAGGPSGLINLTKCERKIPVFASKPHFLDGDPSLTEAVTGVSPPDRSIHDTFINVEPNTGAAMHAAERLQVNLWVQNRTEFTRKFFPKLRHMYFPVLWLSKHGRATQTEADDIVSKVYPALRLSVTLQWSCGAAAVVMCIVVVWMCAYVDPHVDSTEVVPAGSASARSMSQSKARRRRGTGGDGDGGERMALLAGEA